MTSKSPSMYRQGDFLYELEWDSKIDDFFIDILSFQTRIGNFKPGVKNISAMMIVKDAILKEYGYNFSYKYLGKNLALLHKRYTVFGWMLKVDGVVHDSSTNKMSAPNSVWDFMVKKHSFASAYSTYGDVKWEKMKSYFEPREEMNFSNNPEVIVLSSGNSDDDDSKKPHKYTPNNVVEESTVVVNVSSDIPRKKVQKSMTDYLQYVASSECSLDSEFSTANSSNPVKTTDTLLNQLRRKPKTYLEMMAEYQPANSYSESNDPTGKGKKRV